MIKNISLVLLASLVSVSAQAQYRSSRAVQNEVAPEIFISGIFERGKNQKTNTVRIDGTGSHLPMYVGVTFGKSVRDNRVYRVKVDPLTGKVLDVDHRAAFLAAMNAGFSLMKNQLKVGVQGGYIFANKATATGGVESDTKTFIGPEILVNGRLAKRLYLVLGASNTQFDRLNSKTINGKLGVAIGFN